MSKNVRVRFAPSPTGMLHIGGLRTALYNYLFAKHHNGEFLLRIEDTDQNRYVEEAELDIKTALTWAGMPPDEGPDNPGSVGPYRQSERSETYLKYARQLIDQGNAYYAFDSAEDIEALREELKSDENPNPKYDSTTRTSMKNSLTLSKEDVENRIKNGDPYVVRLNVPESGSVEFNDIIREQVSFDVKGLDDQVLMKSDGLPTYHLANVVDDHLMGISHVIRGEEWLSSAPKHILLYKFLGWEAPAMAHLPLIMSPAGGKLSKRNAEELGIPVNVRDYIRLGYEPDALVNFLAFLGWNPGDEREIMTIQELTKEFSLEKVSKSGAAFNIDKLTWYNEHYLRAKSDESLVPALEKELTKTGISGFNDAYLETVVHLLKERVSLTSEFVNQGRFFFEAPSEFDDKAVKKAWKGDAVDLVSEFKDEVEKLTDHSAANLKDKLSGITEARGFGFGKLMLPVRVAITGNGSGPDLFETMELLGKETVVKRLDTALNKFSE